MSKTFLSAHSINGFVLMAIQTLLILAALLSVTYSDGNVCYKCDNVAHPKDCNAIAQCGSHEVCNVQKLVTTSGIIYYKTGCISKQFCNGNGKKRNSDTAICTECCDQNYCNKIPCDTSNVQVVENRCLLCEDVEHPCDCKTLTRCSEDSMCYTGENYNLGRKRYKLGCLSKRACAAMTIRIFGRDLSRRYSQCHECCNTENCNRNLCGTGTSCPATGQPGPTVGPVQVNGGWSSWGSYGSCSKSCGGGTMSQSRSCTNPSPSGGGNFCSGSNTFSISCNSQQCPINGGWSSWGSYGSCSKSCGGGIMSKSRSCTNPSPSGGGNFCSGLSTFFTSCNSQQCPVNGGWSSWGSYGSCSKSCGGGTMSKSRSCTNPSPSGGGNFCSGSNTSFISCNSQKCPFIGSWSNWGSYGSCSKSCGGGTKFRSRTCINPASSNGGTSLPVSATSSVSCNTLNYSNANICYQCENVAHPKDCNKIAKCGPHEVCNVQQMVTMSGIIYYKTGCVSKQVCSASGRKRNTDSAICTKCCDQDFCNKVQCDNSVVAVAEKRCLYCEDVDHPSNCKTVTRCSEDSMCYAGENYNLGRKRYKLGCKSKPACDVMSRTLVGRDFERRYTQCHECCNTENCNLNLCAAGTSSAANAPTTVPVQAITTSVPNIATQSTCKDTLSFCSQYGKTLCGPTYINWALQNCAKFCGFCHSRRSIGLSPRSPSCNNPSPTGGVGQCYGSSTSNITCNTHNCPIDGGFTTWGPWDHCTVTCGNGTQIRTRSCTNPPPQYGGSSCFGSMLSTQHCNTQNCPINGGFSSWGTWSSCSRTCGNGTQSKTRSCSNPSPKYGGASCFGSTSTSQVCNTRNCPINGGFTIWGPWDPCSKTCDNGTQNRSRTCTNPSPQYGGSSCYGSTYSTQQCGTQHCPINGGFTTWASWGPCSQTCGNGTQNRSRNCTNPSPQYGGLSCSGSASSTQKCGTQHCPINGSFTTWGPWGPCSQTCGNGTQNRSRTCTNPSPQFGGLSCSGSTSSTQQCGTQHCPVNGGFNSWGSWGICSKTCGTGIQSKSRTCTNPTPAYGGAFCSGITIVSQYCNTKTCPITSPSTATGPPGKVTFPVPTFPKKNPPTSTVSTLQNGRK